MDSNKKLINRQVILDLLYGDEEFVKEFADASIDSFTEFNEHFKSSVVARDDETLRRAGHKIKPVAQMMNLNDILEMYEKAKEMIENESPDFELEEITKKMDAYCTTLLNELKTIS